MLLIPLRYLNSIRTIVIFNRLIRLPTKIPVQNNNSFQIISRKKGYNETFKSFRLSGLAIIGQFQFWFSIMQIRFIRVWHGRVGTQYVKTEAYHLEASKFSLYVGNNAGVFHPTNQSHGIFFAQIWNQRIELSLLK